MTTRKQVAKKAGVAEGTVSNVLNGKGNVASSKVERVLRAVKELNYTPNHNARSLVMRKSRHIGIAIYETTNPYHIEVAKKIEEHAIKKGYIVSLFMLDNNMEYKLEAIKQRRLDGVVNLMTNDYPPKFIDALKESGTILVNFGEERGTVVNIDYYDATYEMIGKLKKNKCKNIAYITTQDEPGFKVDTRGKAFFDAVKAFHFEKSAVFYNETFDRESTKTGYLLTKKMLADFAGVEAVLCTNDLSAMGCIRALSESGKRVPDDIAVIGCDGIELSQIMVPSLTTLTIDKVAFADEIVKKIVSKDFAGTVTIKATPTYRESFCPR